MRPSLEKYVSYSPVAFGWSALASFHHSVVPVDEVTLCTVSDQGQRTRGLGLGWEGRGDD